MSHGEVIKTYPDGSVEKQQLPAFGEGKGEDCKLAISKAFNEFIQSFHVEGEGKNFCGLYGFTTFNAVRYFENIPVKDTTMAKNDAPDIYYIMYKDIIVFDHFNNTMQLIALSERYGKEGTADDDQASAANRAVGNAELDALMKAVNKANVKPYDFHPVGETTSTLTDEEHKANIRKCIQHCMRGDVFQIVVSRRFVQRYEGDDFKLYRACAASIHHLISSISILVASVSSVLHQKLIIVLLERRLSLILLQERPDERVIWNRIERLQNSSVMTRRRMQNMSCLWIWHEMI